MDERFINKDLELATIIAYLSLMSDMASPFEGRADIKSQDISLILGDLRDRLFHVIYK